MSKSSRPHLRLTVDTDNLVLVIRLYRWREETDEKPDLIGHLSLVAHPWKYNVLFDFRRFIGVINESDVSTILERWRKLDCPETLYPPLSRQLAVVSSDLSLRSLLLPHVDALVHRRIDFFDTFDEGLDWLKAPPLPLRLSA
ncbi:hypothetical protein AEAC466_08780 [Asticcacaulis sp. AC466]|uniref:hypothetical protein n=1 Tax=Asticcacaulis sp. AC466 TaxID=1282362 RepID=UPI0003C40FED|nr:hypothetical protein [Asticcacaulis sp. AC466]ESQ84438.1 hypothetical protein AEAC466_08780 [Asticcacaulis sp. AC466]